MCAVICNDRFVSRSEARVNMRADARFLQPCRVARAIQALAMLVRYLRQNQHALHEHTSWKSRSACIQDAHVHGQKLQKETHGMCVRQILLEDGRMDDRQTQMQAADQGP